MTEERLYGLAVIVCWENSSKTGKLWKESAFVGATGILYLIISSISNLRKPVFNATCAVSDFYANWAV
ncbi:hypothetical protein T08_11650 [Trichinella sp. T8]|nr:hypothetical protein T08_11650 [Trichinella sp. T8]